MGGNRSNQLSTKAPRFHTSKPDCDNLAKAVLDALSDLGAWEDDRQVIRLTVCKEYARNRALCGCDVYLSEVEER